MMVEHLVSRASTDSKVGTQSGVMRPDWMDRVRMHGESERKMTGPQSPDGHELALCLIGEYMNPWYRSEHSSIEVVHSRRRCCFEVILTRHLDWLHTSARRADVVSSKQN